MIPQVAKALSSGFTANQMMKFILRKFPNQKDAIEKALAAGFTGEQVLRYLSRNSGQKLEEPQINTEYAQTKDLDAQRRNKSEQQALTAIAATAAIPAGLSALRSMSAPTQMAMQHAMPTALKPMTPALTGQPQQQTIPLIPSNPPNMPSGQAPISPPPITQPSNATLNQPNNANIPQTIPQVNSKELIEKMGLTQQVKNLMEKLSAKDVADVLMSHMMTPGQKKWLQENSEHSLEQIIEQFGLESAQQPQQSTLENNPISSELSQEASAEIMQPDNLSLPEMPQESTENIQNRAENELIQSNQEKIAPKIAKNDFVATPQGFGNVLENRNGKALIEIDGKKHQVDEDDLISADMPEKDLAELQRDLLQGIEKRTGQEISKNVEWAGYDPSMKELAYKPWQGSRMYVYHDIQPEDAKELTELLTQRKTTGSNYIGAWEQGTDSPIGARMYKIIQRLQQQRGGKGNEYRARYETIYDATEPAKEALKQRHKDEQKLKKTGQQVPKTRETPTRARSDVEKEIKKRKKELKKL